MKMSDQRDLKAEPAAVYTALLDPEILRRCVPGASEVNGNPQDGYSAVVTQKVGPVKATFNGHVTMTDMIENETLTITGEGKGGAAGFAKGAAVVTLEALEIGTRISYDVEAKVGGKLAQLGSRLIDGFAKKMADQFFGNLVTALDSPGEEDTLEEAAEGENADEAPKKTWLKKITRRD